MYSILLIPLCSYIEEQASLIFRELCFVRNNTVWNLAIWRDLHDHFKLHQILTLSQQEFFHIVPVIFCVPKWVTFKVLLGIRLITTMILFQGILANFYTLSSVGGVWHLTVSEGLVRTILPSISSLYHPHTT